MRLDGVSWGADHKSFMARCPHHNDKNASLSVSLGVKGGIVFNCFAQCKTEDILREIGLTFKDISPDKEPKRGFDWKNIVARYYYRNGTRKLRDANKVFTWQHKDGEKWVKGQNAPHMLYKAGEDADKVYFCEGEKDADNIAKMGLCAVSTDDGAKQSPKWRDAYNADVEGKDIVCIPDNDAIGKAHMQGMAAGMYGKARSVKVIDLCAAFPALAEHGDISDIIAGMGEEKTLALLAEIEAKTPEWKPQSTDLVCAENGGISAAIPREITYSRGVPETTIDNFYLFMLRDEQYRGIRFNEMSGRAEIHEIDADGNLTIRPWSDADDARSKHYFELRHEMYAPAKHDAALKILFDSRKYNPLIDIVDALQWDGENRCELFLTQWLKADDTAYTREVSRLIFAGGINRLYAPGCKFDDVPVLIGTKQGEGKSTIIQWLALHDDYSATTKNMSGDQKSIEAIQGAWIVEIPELAAFRATDIESLKAFCTKTFDKYRLPYERNTSIFPRRCIFIGSTNNRQFLTDKTGNRRFYPVNVRSNGYDVFAHENEIRDYILQCWAEARERYKRGEMPAVADRALLSEYQTAQNAAMEDDWRVGVIEDYLHRHKGNGDYVCAKEIFHEALYPDDNRQPAMKDSREIGEIMDSFTEWERCDKLKTTQKYGKQRCWICRDADESNDLSDIFTG